MSGCGTVQPKTMPANQAGSTRRSARARAVTAVATSTVDKSANVPCHFANGEDQVCPNGIATSQYRIQLLRHTHV